MELVDFNGEYTWVIASIQELLMIFWWVISEELRILSTNSRVTAILAIMCSEVNLKSIRISV